MSNPSQIVFNAAYSVHAECRATASFGRAVVARCIMDGPGRTRVYGEQGPGQDFVAGLRFLASDALAAGLTPAAWATGSEVSVTRTGRGETKAVKYRIGFNKETGDAVRLGLEDVAQ